MNVRFGLVTGAAIACAIMAGCKAPEAQQGKSGVPSARPAPRAVEPVDVSKPATAPVTPAVTVTEAPKPVAPRCTCPPGSVHAKPCACGGTDCRCVVKAPEPEYTLYRVKRGDMLSAICKTYGLRQKKVLELNPGLDANKLYAGKTIKLPGTIELKSADAPAAAPASAKPAAAKPAVTAKKSTAKATSYKGETKEYVVKSGDSLGKIAYANGITVKCLKEMNGLSANGLKIGQKLKIPAQKVEAVAKDAAPKTAAKLAPAAEPKAAAAGEAKAAEPAAAAPAAAPTEAAAPAAVPETSGAAPEAAAPAAEEAASADAAAPAAALTHTVKDGEDAVSIAIMYNVSPSVIMDLNDLKQNEELHTGRVLKLPAGAKAQ